MWILHEDRIKNKNTNKKDNMRPRLTNLFDIIIALPWISNFFLFYFAPLLISLNLEPR
jgi:hypothetical protein